MKCNMKKGVSLASLVLYLVLFTAFTAFAASISTNVNEKLFDNRGKAINYSNLNKLQYNIENSALESQDVVLSGNVVTYSNGDVYKYDSDKKVILKNGGVLCQNVDVFGASIETKTTAKKVTIGVSFNKYMNELSKTITSCVEAK